MNNNRMILKSLISEHVSVEDISDVHIDSRLVEKNDIFIAIRGGNKFVAEALNKGAAAVFYDDPGVSVEDRRAVYVQDSVEFIQQLAKDYRKRLDVTVFAITGSNGKTTTKDILCQILSKYSKGMGTKGNYNNHIGVPLTILGIEDDDKFAVLEMGMSGFGEIDLLCKISAPNYGIITNIGESHLEYLKTSENVFKAKTEMLNHIRDEDVFVIGDDSYLGRVPGVVKVGIEESNLHRITHIVEDESGTKFRLDGFEFSTDLVGRHNVKNMSLAILAAEKFGISKELSREVLEKIELTKMRYQKIENGNILYINDAYNASPSSMRASIETFQKFYKDRCKVAVLGDMLELGDESKKYHEDLAEIIEKCDFDFVYLYGQNMRHLFVKLKHPKKFHFNDKDEISKKILELGENMKIAVLLKGSRGMKLEEIIKNYN